MGGKKGLTVEERFWSKVDTSSDCWEWVESGRRSDGYGRFYMDGTMTLAHRVSYILNVGPIPEGLVIDHLCRNPPCVNPGHLEAVTNKENVDRGLRSYLLRGSCKNGHDMTLEENVILRANGQHACLPCKIASDGARIECPVCGSFMRRGSVWRHIVKLHAWEGYGNNEAKAA